LIFLIPIVDRMVRMDLRVVTIDVARQEVMTRDNVPMTVDAVVYFRVIDPAAAVVRVEQYLRRRVSGCRKTRAGGIDDFCATDRPATALLTDDEGNFERA
jgi:regulator of protease activity HflC (stomatin/prohibitin superfamily)